MCIDGILLLAENSEKITVSNYIDTKKIFPINSCSAVAATGQPGDFNRIIGRIRNDDKNNQAKFSNLLTGRKLSTKISEIFHLHSIYWHLRPFACSLILGTISAHSLELFALLPTGVSSKCFTTAIGRNAYLLKLNLMTGITSLKSCRRNLNLISKYLIQIHKNYQLGTFEIQWYTKDSADFKKPYPSNLNHENDRKNKIFAEIIDEELKRKQINAN